MNKDDYVNMLIPPDMMFAGWCFWNNTKVITDDFQRYVTLLGMFASLGKVADFKPDEQTLEAVKLALKNAEGIEFPGVKK